MNLRAFLTCCMCVCVVLERRHEVYGVRFIIACQGMVFWFTFKRINAVHGACATSVWRFLIELRFRHHFASTMFDGSNRCRGWAESP